MNDEINKLKAARIITDNGIAVSVDAAGEITALIERTEAIERERDDYRKAFQEERKARFAPASAWLMAILDCYSPDDTVGDYQDKIRKLFGSVLQEDFAAKPPLTLEVEGDQGTPYTPITLANLKAGKLTAARVYVGYCEVSEKLKAAEGAIKRYEELSRTSSAGSAVVMSEMQEREAFVDWWKKHHQYSPTFRFLDDQGNFCTPEDDPIHFGWIAWKARAVLAAASPVAVEQPPALSDEQIDNMVFAKDIQGYTYTDDPSGWRALIRNLAATPTGKPVAWRVTGNYTDQPFKDESSADAYMHGLLSSDPDGGYCKTPLYAAAQAHSPKPEEE